MIEIEMSKDIHEFEPRQIGPCTKRQLICIMIAGAVAALVYAAIRPLHLDMYTATMIVMLPSVPVLLCGFITKYGMHLETFLLRILTNMILTPPRRPYKAFCAYAYLDPEDVPETLYSALPKSRRTRKEKKARRQGLLKFKGVEA